MDNERSGSVSIFSVDVCSKAGDGLTGSIGCKFLDKISIRKNIF
jgi:hypothetical protein